MMGLLHQRRACSDRKAAYGALSQTTMTGSEAVTVEARWDYYFEPCQAVSSAGAAVSLPEGNGMVTLGENVVSEHVFFPAGQVEFDLVPGEIKRLERKGLAQRHGQLRCSNRAR